MKPELKKQIEEAAIDYSIESTGSDIPEDWEFEAASFRAGAEWLYSKGYRFNELEMIDFANWYINRRQMEYMTPSEGFNRWVKERESK